MIKFFIIMTLGIISNFVLAQEFEWDEIPDQELQMTGFELDPEAHAVILFDVVYMNVTKDFDMLIKRHQRIKIFSEEGKKHADIEFYFWEDDKLLDLEAHAYSPDGEETEFDDDLMQIQKLDDWNRCYFAIPGVQAGSVIEFKYELFRPIITYLRPWYFQHDIFTALSQLTVALQPGFAYSAFPENVDQYNLDFQSEEFYDIDSRKNNKRFTWRLINVPAFKSERYMYNKDDHYAKIHFQMNSYKNYTFIKSLDDLAKQVYESFEKCIAMDSGLESFTTELISECKDDGEKIDKIFRFVKDSIETEEHYDLWAYNMPDEVLEKRTGHPSCKNLLLINMLFHAGIEAHPVLISTRSNGKLRMGVPSVSQFDHLLVQVVTDKQKQYLDCSDDICPQGVLTLECNVPHGLLVQKEKGILVNIDNKKFKNSKKISSTINIDSGNQMNINSKFILSGYPAVEEKARLLDKAAVEFASEKLSDSFANFHIDTFWVEEQSDPLEMVYHIEYQVNDYLVDAGSVAYMSLPLVTKMESNPLVSEKRNYPVDFDYEIEAVETVKINLPDNFEVSEFPLRVRENAHDLTFSSFCFKSKKSIELNRQYKRKKSTFSPSEYKELRRIYDVMTGSDQNQIVFTKL